MLISVKDSEEEISSEEIAAEEYEDDIVARRMSTERKFGNDMKQRSFLERDMQYTAAGKFSAKLLIEVQEIVDILEDDVEPQTIDATLMISHSSVSLNEFGDYGKESDEEESQLLG